MTKQDKNIIENRKNEIIQLIKEFCSQNLDDEYFVLSVRLIDKLGRKRIVPFLSGKKEIWAAAIIHALGTINFLFDKSFKPYVTIEEINDFFGTNKSSTGSKSKVIRDLLNLGYFDNEFSINRIKENNPFDKLMMINGFIVSKNIEPKAPVKEITKTEKNIVKINKPVDKSQMDLFKYD